VLRPQYLTTYCNIRFTIIGALQQLREISSGGIRGLGLEDITITTVFALKVNPANFLQNHPGRKVSQRVILML